MIRSTRPGVRRFGLGLAAAVLAAACSNDSSAPTPTGSIDKVNHVVVIYLENHSFDNLYGEFAGANGLANAGNTLKQVDTATSTAFDTLPQVAASPFPTWLPNQPFDISQYVPPSVATRDLVHRYYQEQMQIDSGKMDKFVSVSDALGLSMGYYHTSLLPLASWAYDFTLCDNFYHSAFGGSFLNHMFLIAAAAPTFPSAPAAVTATLDGGGHLLTDGFVTPDGFAVNTSYSVNQPHPSSTPAQNLVPNQTLPTIGDRLTDKNVSWAWYAGGWDDAMAGHPAATYQFHHQPFIYFSNYADGTPAKAAHLKDENDFLTAAAAGTLPAVSFVKPLGVNNEHPGYTDLITGENHVIQLLNAIRNGPNWKDVVVIITYDEHGGFWDHVAPPAGDRWGPGSRVPTIIVSPFARRGFVDHTQYETVSILSFIEKRWGLPSLSDKDGHANPLSNAFDFGQTN